MAKFPKLHGFHHRTGFQRPPQPFCQIAGRKVGADYSPYIIAEMSGNHLRDLNRARMIFEQAKLAGVDAIKIQTYTPSSLALNIAERHLQHKPQWQENWGWGTESIYNLYQQVYTPQGDFTDALFQMGKDFDIPVCSTPVNVADARLLATRYNPPAYKVGALEIDFFPLLEVIAQTGKPIILNTAIATAEKIEATLDFLFQASSGPVILLTGPKVYHDDSAKNFGLGRLHALQQRHGKEYVIGLSDHFRGGSYNGTYYQGHEFSTTGILRYDAAVIEKHFCGCHSGLPGKALGADGRPDWSRSDIDGTASLTTEEMRAHVEWATLAHAQRSGLSISADAASELKIISRKAEYGYGVCKIGPSQAEIDTNEAGATRFIYAQHDLPSGHTLTLADLHFSRAIHHAHPQWRTQTPLPTASTRQVLGNVTSTALEKGDPIFAENLTRKIDLSAPYSGGLFPINASAQMASV